METRAQLETILRQIDAYIADHVRNVAAVNARIDQLNEMKQSWQADRERIDEERLLVVQRLARLRD